MRCRQVHLLRSILGLRIIDASSVGVKNAAAIFGVVALAFIITCALSGLFSSHAPRTHAAIARKVPFSARLKSVTTGNIVEDGNYAITFSLYTVESSGTALWSETQTVAVKDGIITTDLGSATAFPSSLDFNAESYYLEIKVGTDPPMTPRKRVSAVPMALNAATIDGSEAGTGANDVLRLDSSGNIVIQGGATFGSGVTVGGSILPDTTGIYNLGSSTAKFATIFADSISASSTTISGTESEAFTINTDQTTNNTESSSIRFYLGPTLNTYAALQWTGSSNRFDLYSRQDASTHADLALAGLSATTGNFSSTLSVTGATTLNSTLGVSGNFSVNTNKLTVAAATGNTAIAGTLSVTGDASLSTLSTSGAATLNSTIITNSASVGTTLGVTGATTLSSTLNVNGNTTLGDASSDTITFTGQVASNIIPSADNTYDLGSPTRTFRKFYATEAVFEQTTTPNTTSNSFVINSDAEDDEDSSLEFYRGEDLTAAKLLWDSTNDRLDLNTDVLVQGSSTLGNAASDTTTLRGAVTLNDSSSTYKLLFGTSSPAGLYQDSANTLGSDANITLARVADADAGTTTRDSRALTFQGAYWNGSANTNVTGGILLDVIADSPTYGVALQTAGSTHVFLNQTGNLGIGTTTPSGKVDVITVPTATANYGVVNLGPATTSFDGSSAGRFSGNSAGTYMAINAASGYTGDFARFQTNGENSLVFKDAYIGIPITNARTVFSYIQGSVNTLTVFGYAGLNLNSGATVSLAPSTSIELSPVNPNNDLTWAINSNTRHVFLYRGSSSDDRYQDAIRVQPSGSLSTYYRPLAVYNGSSDTVPWFYLDSTNKLQFGAANSAADTNLYRSAADTLKTDDSFSVAANFTIGDASGDSVTANAATWTFANDTNFALSGGVNGLSFDGTTLSIDATNNLIGLGTAAPGAQLHLAGGVSSSAWTTNGIGIRQAAATYTDTSSSGTVTTTAVNAIGTATLAASSSTTYTHAASWYIESAPSAGTNATITNPWALLVDSGNVRLDGRMFVNYSSDTGQLFSVGSTAFTTSSAIGTGGALSRFGGSSLTITDGAGSGTVSSAASNSFPVHTIAASSTVTYTDFANLYVGDAVAAGSNVTITNNYAMWIDSGNARFDGQLSIATGTAPAANLSISGTNSKSSSATGGAIRVVAGTQTATSDSGTVALAAGVDIGAITFAASSTTTYTNAASLYLRGAAAAGSNVTITNPYALFIDAGNVRIDDKVSIGTAATPTANLDVATANSTTDPSSASGFRTASGNITDTASSGTVSLAVANAFGRPTFAASSATTYTQGVNLYFSEQPQAGSNVTLSNQWDIYGAGTAGGFRTAGVIQAGSLATKVTSSTATFTGTTGGIVTIGRNDITVNASDSLGTLQFYGNDTQTTTNNVAANIEALASATIGSDVNPGILVFRTTGTGVAATPTEAFRVDASQQLGVNTTGPDRRLDVLDASNPQVRLTYTDGSVYTDLQTDSSGYLNISTTGGIAILNGTGSGSTAEHGTFRLNNVDNALSNDGDQLGILSYYSNDGSSNGTGIGASITAATARSGGNKDTGVELIFSTRSGTGFEGSANAVERAVLDRQGYLGLNTTGPDRRLDILDASNPQLRLTYADGTTYSELQTDSSGNLTITTSGTSVTFSSDEVTIGTDLTVTSGVRIGVGSTPNSLTALADDSLFVEGAVEFDGALRVDGAVTVTNIFVATPSTLQTLSAGTAISANATKVRVVGSGGAVTLTAAPTIADGTDGQVLIIQGTDDTNTVAIQDQDSLASSNVQLGAASRTLGKGDVLTLTFDGTDSLWYEVTFTNN